MAIDVVAAIVGITGTIKQLREAIGSRQSVEALKERLGLAADRLEFVQEQLTAIGAELAAEKVNLAQALAENLELRRETGELHLEQEQLSAKLKPRPPVEREGLLFMRQDDEATFTGPFCPNCKRRMSVVKVVATCEPCKYTKLIPEARIRSIIAGLNRGV